MKLKWIVGVAATIAAVASAAAQEASEPPPLEPKAYTIGVTASHIAGPIGPLFEPEAPWQEALAGLDSYKYYGVQAPGVDWAAELDVPSFVEFCARNGLNIECEFGNFFVGDGKLLGDSAFEHAISQLDPIVDAGATVEAVTLDGPLCRILKGICLHADALELDEAAEELVRFFSLVRGRYPGIRIGWTPNLPNWDYTEDQAGVNGFNTDLSGHTYLAVLEAVYEALADANDRLDFIEIDCPYNYYQQTVTAAGDAPVDYPRQLRDLQEWCLERDVDFCLIVNAEHRGGGGQAFHDLTLEYVRALRQDGVFPDSFIIQSWYDQPDRNLPETEPGTFTNAVRDAIRLIRELFPSP